MNSAELVSLEVYARKSRLTIGEILTRAAAAELQLHWDLLVGLPMCRVEWVERPGEEIFWRPVGVPAYGKNAPIRTGRFTLSLEHNPALEYCFGLMAQGHPMSHSNLDGEPDALILQDVYTGEWWCIYDGEIGEPNPWAWPRLSELLVQRDTLEELVVPTSRPRALDPRLVVLREWFEQQTEFTSDTISTPRTGRRGGRSACWLWLGDQGIAEGELFAGAKDGKSKLPKKFTEAWSAFLEEMKRRD